MNKCIKWNFAACHAFEGRSCILETSIRIIITLLHQNQRILSAKFTGWFTDLRLELPFSYRTPHNTNFIQYGHVTGLVKREKTRNQPPPTAPAPSDSSRDLDTRYPAFQPQAAPANTSQASAQTPETLNSPPPLYKSRPTNPTMARPSSPPIAAVTTPQPNHQSLTDAQNGTGGVVAAFDNTAPPLLQSVSPPVPNYPSTNPFANRKASRSEPLNPPPIAADAKYDIKTVFDEGAGEPSSAPHEAALDISTAFIQAGAPASITTHPQTPNNH